MEDIRDLIENYQFYIKQSDELHKKLIQLQQYYTKVTAAYGHNTFGGKGIVSSKVERCVMRIRETEEKIMAIEEKITIVNKAERVLNNKEKEVIQLIKDGYRNKVTRMARILGQDKNYVVTKRDSAIKKMSEFIGR